jgi:hypothetical protein
LPPRLARRRRRDKSRSARRIGHFADLAVVEPIVLGDETARISEDTSSGLELKASGDVLSI